MTDRHPPEKTPFKPFIASEKIVPEATLRAILLGLFLGIVFAAANAYLGLYIGLTVSASIPAAVMSMAILRGLMKKGTILENNIVQTIASSGESLAAGIIFTIPAFFIWNATRGDVELPSILTIMYITVVGGTLGIVMMIPLRRILIRDEHATLPYPEGTACAEVLIAGERGGARAMKVIWGVVAGALYKLGTGLGLLRETLTVNLGSPRRAYLGIDALPALLGVGYILGPRISAVMLAGGALGSMVIVPLIAFFGSTTELTVFPALTQRISEMDGEAIRQAYVRYIGAGAVTMGGIMGLVKSLPALLKSLRGAFHWQGRSTTKSTERTDRDLSTWFIVTATIAVGLFGWALTPDVWLVFPLVMIFGFIFVMVSSRIVGIVGSSSNPVSGMTIATLLGTTVLFVKFGYVGVGGMVASLMVGAIVCVGVCSAGDISQDLKTGFLVGATPYKQQLAEFVGLVAGASVVGFVVYLLGSTYGFVADAAHPHPLQAPQANLIAIMIQGVMHGQLPWDLVFIGMGLSLIVELLGVSSLAFAVGLYLPVGLSAGVMVGGLVRFLRDRKVSLSEGEDPGILFSSGLIAGEALIGIAIAVVASVGIITDFARSSFDSIAAPAAIVLYSLLVYSLWRMARSLNT